MPLVPSDPRARRILLAGCAGLLLTLPVLAHDSLNGRLLTGWLAVLAGVVLALAALAVRRVPGRLATLACAAVLGATAASTVVLLISTVTGAPSAAALPCRDDVSAATFGAADELRAGHNPYASYDSLRVERASGCATPAATVLRQGRFAQATSMPSEADVRAAVQAALRDPTRPEIERNLNYPGGSVLLGLVGPAAFPWLMAGLLVAAVVATVRRSGSRLRPYVAVALAAQAALLSLIPDGHTDAAVVALLLLAWGSPTTVLGGLALGLACGTKQTAWLLAPALLATAYARGGRPALVRSAAAAALGFAALNLPFVVMGPGAWLHGVMGPMVDGLFPLGAGLIGLVTSGTLPVTLTPLFTVLMAGCVVASVVAALRWDRARPGIGVLIGGLALFLGPRSLLEYLAGAGVLLVCVVATAPQREAAEDAALRPESRRLQSTRYGVLDAG